MPQGAKNAAGYGVIRVGKRTIGVHRIALAHKLNAPDLLEPAHMSGVHKRYALHSCDNPACCNPKHLRLGSGQDNGDDKRERGRSNPNPKRQFSDDQIREIREYGETWGGLCDMMKKYRVGQNAIENIISRKFYKHVV